MSITTAADIAALTVRQRDVLGQIAIGFEGGHHPAVLRRLLAQGMLEAKQQQVPSGLRGVPLTITRYAVPVAVHIAWSEWCATQAGGDGTALP